MSSDFIGVRAWSWQTTEVRKTIGVVGDPEISQKGSSRINKAIVLAAFPVMNLFAAGLFLAIAYELSHIEDKDSRALAKHFIGMAVVTAVAGFVPFAMPIIFAIGTKYQSVSKVEGSDNSVSSPN